MLFLLASVQVQDERKPDGHIRALPGVRARYRGPENSRFFQWNR